MHHPSDPQSRDLRTRLVTVSCFAVLALAMTACGGATRHASSPHGKATTTAASIDRPRLARLVVAEQGVVTMVERDGCVATARAAEGESGDDELRVRCPRTQRIQAWFEGADRLTAAFVLEPPPAERESHPMTVPAARVLVEGGKVMKVSRLEDVQRLTASVKAFTAELASTEQPAPGPDSPAGWQLLHVSGPAHVMFGGTPARGAFDARVSTNGQYMCEFVTNGEDGPMHASKSGYLAPKTAARAIDEVLAPFSATGAARSSTYAAGVRGGTEARSNAASTVEVFERFAGVQEAIGDACLPELETPSPSSLSL